MPLTPCFFLMSGFLRWLKDHPEDTQISLCRNDSFQGRQFFRQPGGSLQRDKPIFSKGQSRLCPSKARESVRCHKVRWEWYGPDKKLYYTTGNTRIKPSSGKYTKQLTAWHNLSIQGDKAQEMPGEWQLKVYFDNEMLDAKKFYPHCAKKGCGGCPTCCSDPPDFPR